MAFFDEAIEVLEIIVRALHKNPRDGWRYQPKITCPSAQRAFDSRRHLSNRRKISPCNRKTTA